MSYILDALRKADSEREREEVPGLHAHPVVSTGEDARSSTSVNHKLLLAVGVLTVLLLFILVWLMWGRGESQPDHPPLPPDQAAMTPPPPPLSPPRAPEVAPALAQTTPPPLPPTSDKPAPGLYPPALTQQPAVETATPATPKTAPPSLHAATEDTHVYRLMDLPESVRRDLPTLTIGGAMYSDTPSNRMLIINSQVLHEGDKISADLTLEQIKLKSAVFRFRTYRYLVSY